MDPGPPPLRADLVCEGGGVKGIALTGAVLRLNEAGYTFPRIAGTSAGAVVGAVLAALQAAGEPLHRAAEVARSLDYRREPRYSEPVRGPVSLALAVVQTTIEASQAQHVAGACDVERSVFVDTSDISAVDFDITQAQQEALYEGGRRAAERFLATWSYEDWRSRCAAGPTAPPGPTPDPPAGHPPLSPVGTDPVRPVGSPERPT